MQYVKKHDNGGWGEFYVAYDTEFKRMAAGNTKEIADHGVRFVRKLD